MKKSRYSDSQILASSSKLKVAGPFLNFAESAGWATPHSTNGEQSMAVWMRH